MPPGPEGTVAVHRALLSVHDTAGLADFARTLSSLGIELVATRGTRTRLDAENVATRAAEELTGIGAWFEGRIKTLHPGLLGGILAPRTPAGLAELEAHHLLPIDLVVVNFYPFESEAAARDDPEELIDVGGVTLARAAAKNHGAVAIVTSPEQYGPVAAELRQQSGSLSAKTRRSLASAAFERTAAYDAAIAGGLAPGTAASAFPSRIVFEREPIQLRYGENPHQAAAVYRRVGGGAALEFTQTKGAPISFTNLLDLETAVATVAEFSTPTAAVVKHATPVGVASGATMTEALEHAIATDPVARYGCVIATNRPIGAGDVPPLHGVFVDALAAPSYDAEAISALGRRPKLKLLTVEPPAIARPRWEAHSGFDRLLLQEADRRELAPAEVRSVTTETATPEERASLEFAWRVVRHAKSNAIVLADGSMAVGIGSGQPTRVKAVELAIEVAGERAKGSVLASDAFFPFADGIEVAGKAGIRAILQPGGSMRDAEVIAMADRYRMAMYFTGWRVFRH